MNTKKTFSFIIIPLLAVSLFSQTPGTKKWNYLTGGAIYSSPAIGTDGAIYIGSDDNKLYAINHDGTKRWEFLTGSSIISSPAIGEDGTIYVGSLDYKLYAVNADGTKKWEYLTSSAIYKNPAIGADKIIYIGSGDILYAINPNGTKKWEYLTGNEVTSSPAIDTDGTIYVASWDNLYAINSDGTKKWKYLIGDIINSSPSIGSDGVIYVGANNKKLCAINPDGTKKWEFRTGNDVFSSPAIGVDGTIYIGSNDKSLYAINPNGSEKWEYLTGYDINSSPAIGSDGTIYIGSGDKLFAINPNGTKKWEYLVGDAITSSPSIDTDGTVYVGSYDSKLYALFSFSYGLANSSWPKYQHDNFNRSQGQIKSLGVDNTDFSNMVPTNQSYTFKINLTNIFKSNITITNVQISDADLELISTLPITIIPGVKKEVSFTLTKPQNKWYKPIISNAYSAEGKNYTNVLNLEGIIFLDDNTELAHTANQVMQVWKSPDKITGVLFNNTKGIIHRLLSNYAAADSCFDLAVSKALNARYGYAGIMMNTGVVKSDQAIPDSANVFYTDALKDIQATAATSALAPQVYYNQAWEAYKNTQYADASTLAMKTINHSKANTYLKAKAYTLLGAIRYAQGKQTDAIDAFNQAVTLDKNGPIGQMARENLEMILGSGIDLNPVGSDIKIYPNPSDGKMVISTGNLPGNLNIIVFNQTGEKIYSSQITGSANSSRDLDLSQLAGGVYTVLIVSDNLAFTDKIVIIK